jgi:hypothetical protein
VKETNLSIFYRLGTAIKDVDKLETGMSLADAAILLLDPYAWLVNFVGETEGVNIPDSRAAAERLMASMNKLANFAHFTGVDPERLITSEEVYLISGQKRWFETCFEREYRYLDVFTVTPKGIYDTRLLMTRPEDKFPPRVRNVLPDQTLADLKQAARSLAFDLPTACAFHICRATESLILKYYEVLSGHGWTFTKKDWKIYVEQLVKEGAPKKITDRLDEIRETDRNAYTHPEKNVSLEEAPIQFELCTGVIFQMASEIDKKLTP